VSVAYEDITMSHTGKGTCLNLLNDLKWLCRKCLICSCLVYSQCNSILLKRVFFMHLVWNTVAFNFHLIMLSHQECTAWITRCAFEPHEKLLSLLWRCFSWALLPYLSIWKKVVLVLVSVSYISKKKKNIYIYIYI